MVQSADDDDIYQEVGKRIRQIRERRRLTQAQLAVAVSLSRTSITNIERGKQRLPLHILAHIATALDVQPSNLLPVLEPADVGVHPKARADLTDKELSHVRRLIGSLRRTQ